MARPTLLISRTFFHSPSKYSRSGKIVLSSEPNNLMNLNSFKYSGLANSKAVGVTTAKDSKGRKCGELRLKVGLVDYLRKIFCVNV